MPFDATGFQPGNAADPEVLRRARALIASWWCWCRFEREKRSALGLTQYCALGALQAVGYSHLEAEAMERAATQVWMAGRKDCGSPVGPAEVNDYLGHRATLRMFDIAIQEAEAGRKVG